MASVTLRWRSDVLGKQTTAQVILPDSGKGPFATFYLLHGLSDDSSNWSRNTRIESYVSGLPLIVVMPDGYRGFYTNHEQGPAYARHIGEELPAQIERLFPAKAERAGRAVGGLSMGGYGALRIGLGYAERFCSVNSHSGAVGWGGLTGAKAYREAARARGWSDDFRMELERIFGLSPEGTDHDLLALAKKAKRAGRLPALSLDCGTEDFLLADNRNFTARLKAAKIPHTYQEYPGAHTWEYWDLHVREAVAFHRGNLGIG